MDSDETFDTSKDNPFNFREDLSLQLLASTKLALRLWRDKIYNKTQCNRSTWVIWDSTWLDWIDDFSCQNVFVVPTKIANLVDNRMKLISYEVRIWLENFMPVISRIGLVRELSHEKLSEMFLELFDNIVLKLDVTICLKSTAAYILKNLQLLPQIKYKIACEFCLEDWVRQIWPLVRNDADMPGQSSLVKYWNNVMDNIVDQQPIESRLTISLNKNKPAFEYFWDKLTEERQVIWTIKVLRNADVVDMNFFLAKLNEIQAERVCVEVGDRIFGTMMEKDEYFEHAMKSWFYMKSFIPVNLFDNIVRQLWGIVFNHAGSNIARLDRSNALLLKLWTSAPDRLKSYILDRQVFLNLFCELDSKVRGVDNYHLEFIFELLTNADIELRNSVWIRCWRKLIVRAKPSKLEEIMKLCIVDEKEIERFKENEMANFEELEDYFNLCVEKGLYAELCEYLNFCVNNPKRLENLSKEIISSNLYSILSCDKEKIVNFHSFIRRTFLSVERVNKFTEELVLAPEFLGFVYSKLDTGCFDEIINVSDRFPTSGKNLTEVKRAYLDYYFRNLERGQITGFVAQKFDDFLKWCSANETTILEFKQTLNIDVIFEIIVNKFCQERFNETSTIQDLSNFDHFLEWYFGSSEGAKIYKSTTVLHYQENLDLKITLKQANLQFLDQFLKWAFDNDTVKVENVRSTLGR
ncbi:hypothetical protein U1Q18_048574 [Sarracenia purpurea var. burkii]